MSKDRRKSNVYLSKEGYNIWAKKYNESLPLLNSFEKGRFFELIGDLREKNVVDFGAGTGRLSEMILMNGGNLTALDFSEEMLEILKKKYPEVSIIVSDVLKTPIEDESVDLAVSAFLIVHLNKPELFFREVYRVLRSGGEFVLSNINQRKAPKLKLNNKEEIVIKSFYHRPQDIISKLEDECFEVVKELFVEENGVWVNQIIKCRKK
jgi:ubiquinone/menaquinone biosynthesis C-methylase UbiE